MEKPEGCPDRLYDLMQRCWRHNRKNRPTFLQLIELLIPDLNDQFKDCSYYFSTENQDHDHEEEENDSMTPLTQSPQRQHRTPDGILPGGGGHGEMDLEEDDLDNIDVESQNSTSSSRQSAHSPRTLQKLAEVGTSSVCGHSQPCDCANRTPPRPKKTPSQPLWNAVPPRQPPAPGPQRADSHGQNMAGGDRAVDISPNAVAAGGQSSDGSKGSSKSCESNHSGGLNGFVNGHIPQYFDRPTQPQNC